MINYQEMTFDDYIKILRRRRSVLGILLVLGVVIGYAVSLVLPKQYVSKSLVLIEQQQIPQNYVQPVVPGALDQRVLQIMESVLSRKNLEAMIERFGLAKDQRNETSIEALATNLRNNIKVMAMGPSDSLDKSGAPVESPGMGSTQRNALGGFYVNVTYSDPSVAQQMCANITSSFIEENLRLREQSSVGTTDFLESQLEDAKRKLDEQDQVLAAFKSKHIGRLPDDAQMNMNLLLSLNTQLDSATQALDRAQGDKVYLESLLAQQVANWKALQSLNSPETIETELARQQIKLADLEARYSSKHPDVIAARKSLAELKRHVEESKASASQPAENKNSAVTDEPPQIVQLRSQVYQAEQTVQEKTREQQRLQEQINLYQQRIQTSPAIEQQYKDLTRGHDTALKLYDDLLAKRSESVMTSNMERRQEGERFRVMEPANLPKRPSFPNPVLFTGGGLGGGLVLGICLTLLLETSDRTLRTEREVEVYLQLPVLAHLPTVKETGMKRGFRLRRRAA
jgi:polysaccharide chain length determinant protein (PEP-CTERM system associated)